MLSGGGLFITTASLVHRLLAEKRDLRLDREPQALDRFGVVIIDDLGYVQKDQQEMEVLFTFLGQRYEPRSVRFHSIRIRLLCP